MKIYCAGVISLFLISFSSFAQGKADDNTSAADQNKVAVMAEVGKASILLEDFLIQATATQKALDRDLTADEKNKILDTMIDSLLFYQAAADEDLIITVDEMDRYLLDYFEVHKLINKSEEEIKEYFINSTEFFNYEDFLKRSEMKMMMVKYLARHKIIPFFQTYHIFFSTIDMTKRQKQKQKVLAEKAQKLINREQNDFREVCATISQDEATAKSGGYLGVLAETDQTVAKYGKNFISEVMKTGIYELKLVESKFGYHVIMNKDYSLPPKLIYENEIKKLMKKYKVKITSIFKEKDN